MKHSFLDLLRPSGTVSNFISRRRRTFSDHSASSGIEKTDQSKKTAAPVDPPVPSRRRVSTRKKNVYLAGKKSARSRALVPIHRARGGKKEEYRRRGLHRRVIVFLIHACPSLLAVFFAASRRHPRKTRPRHRAEAILRNCFFLARVNVFVPDAAALGIRATSNASRLSLFCRCFGDE